MYALQAHTDHRRGAHLRVVVIEGGPGLVAGVKAPPMGEYRRFESCRARPLDDADLPRNLRVMSQFPSPVVRLHPNGAPPAEHPEGVSSDDLNAAVLTKLGVVEHYEQRQDAHLASLSRKINAALLVACAGLATTVAHLLWAIFARL